MELLIVTQHGAKLWIFVIVNIRVLKHKFVYILLVLWLVWKKGSVRFMMEKIVSFLIFTLVFLSEEQQTGGLV